MSNTGTGTGTLHQFESASALDQQLADDIALRLENSVSNNGRATLVVSGGKTPLGLFNQLSRKSLPWHAITVTLADERWVPPTDNASNEKLVREHLLVDAAASAQFVALKFNTASPTLALGLCTEAINRLGRFDAVVLGMGDDGHTASLFPGTANLAQGLAMDSGQSCIAVTPPAAPHERMSLTLPRLLNTDALYLHITGAAKREVLSQAEQRGNPHELPIAAVLNQTVTPTQIYFAE